MSISDPIEQQLLMAGYVLGDLSLEEGRAFEQMLLSDPALQQELAQLQMAMEQVYGQVEEPPSDLRISILSNAKPHLAPSTAAQSDKEQSSISQPVSPTRTASSSQKTVWIVSAMLATLSLFLGWQNYRLRQALQVVQTERASSAQASSTRASSTQASSPTTYSLEATENATELTQDSAVALLVSADRSAANLEVEGLPALPDGQVYVLWTVTPDGTVATTDEKNAILTAVFEVDEAGNSAQKVMLPSVFQDLAQVKGLAVTIEDADAPQAHQSSPILFYRL